MSGRRAARHAQTSGGRRWLVGLGAVVGAVVVAAAIVVALGWLPGSGENDADTASNQPTSGRATSDGPSTGAPDSPSAGGDGQGSAGSVPKAVRACATSISRAENAVTVARKGVDDWSDHVQARTDMLEGRMSRASMDAIWKRTRLAGPGDQKRFRAALAKYDGAKACGRLDDVPAADRALARRCTDRSRAATRAVASAEAAMKDWEVHLANMATFADGGMTAAMAQDRWVQSWRNAPRNIAAYRAARASLADAPSCRAAGA